MSIVRGARIASAGAWVGGAALGLLGGALGLGVAGIVSLVSGHQWGYDVFALLLLGVLIGASAGAGLGSAALLRQAGLDGTRATGVIAGMLAFVLPPLIWAAQLGRFGDDFKLWPFGAAALVIPAIARCVWAVSTRARGRSVAPPNSD
jgi:hypothetical protein